MNKTALRLLLIAVGIVAIVFVSAIYYLGGHKAGGPKYGIACTQEAKLCPDGSSVGRTGPNCEFAACPVGGQSGIRGTVMLGPTCPVQRIPPDPNCADKPYSTFVAIFRKSDPVHAVALLNSNASGTFSASLPAGDYIVGAGESNLPRCAQQEVAVAPDSVREITISCDTGIR